MLSYKYTVIDNKIIFDDLPYLQADGSFNAPAGPEFSAFVSGAAQLGASIIQHNAVF